MDIETIRRYCLAFPHASENVQWGSDLCFKVDGKLFVVAALEPGAVRLVFKCSPENFAELCERPGVRPAPYLARANWVGLEQLNALRDSELREFMAESYRLVWEGLPKRRQQQLEGVGKVVPGVSAGKKKVQSKRELERAKASGK